MTSYAEVVASHLPEQDEIKQACRAAIAEIRDQASAGMHLCTDAAYPFLAEIAHRANLSVYAPDDARTLVLMRYALIQAMDAARAIERACK